MPAQVHGQDTSHPSVGGAESHIAGGMDAGMPNKHFCNQSSTECEESAHLLFYVKFYRDTATPLFTVASGHFHAPVTGRVLVTEIRTHKALYRSWLAPLQHKGRRNKGTKAYGMHLE